MRPTFVIGHPSRSRRWRADQDDPFVTERFELFVDSRELANGYSELNDPVEQRERFEEEQAAKDAGDSERGTVDEDYLCAPSTACADWRVGNRHGPRSMLLAGVDNIREVILFPTLRPSNDRAARARRRHSRSAWVQGS